MIRIPITIDGVRYILTIQRAPQGRWLLQNGSVFTTQDGNPIRL